MILIDPLGSESQLPPVLFLIDEKALTWSLYFAGPGGAGLVPQEVNTGVLLRGRVGAHAPFANRLASRLAESRRGSYGSPGWCR